MFRRERLRTIQEMSTFSKRWYVALDTLGSDFVSLSNHAHISLSLCNLAHLRMRPDSDHIPFAFVDRSAHIAIHAARYSKGLSQGNEIARWKAGS